MPKNKAASEMIDFVKHSGFGTVTLRPCKNGGYVVGVLITKKVPESGNWTDLFVEFLKLAQRENGMVKLVIKNGEVDMVEVEFEKSEEGGLQNDKKTYT